MVDGRGRGRGSRRSSRHGPRPSKPPPRCPTTSSKSKSSTSFKRHPPTRRIHSAMKVQSPATTLPADLWTRLLPLLTWRDTTEMLTVCSEWRNALKSAKKLHPEWKSTVLGPSSNGSESLELLRTNHLNWADTRFPPDLILLSATSKDPSPWHTGGYWEEAIAAIEEAKLLPLKCRIVGIFTINEVLGKNEEEEEEERDSSAVTLSISVAHLPETTVEMAEFDRKDLRRCQRGVELDNPFTELEKHESPSFLLFGVNDQSASQLVPVVEEWYPLAPVIGGVSPLIDRCVPLATYFREPVHPKRKKNRAGKRRPCPRGQVSFPSTMLLRFHGNIGIKSFSSSGYYPVTPVLRCEHTSEVKLAKMVMCDLVSMSHNDSEEPQLHCIMELIEPSERLAIEQEGRALNIFSCSDSAPLDFLLSKSDVIPTTQIDLLEFVFWARGALLMSSLSWPEGAYGVLASHQPTRTSQSLTEALRSTKEALSSVNERAFGAFVVAGALDDVKSSTHAEEVSQLYTEAFGDNLGGCLVSSTVGPVAFPGGFRPVRTTTQVQTHTTCGAIFFTKA